MCYIEPTLFFSDGVQSWCGDGLTATGYAEKKFIKEIIVGKINLPDCGQERPHTIDPKETHSVSESRHSIC